MPSPLEDAKQALLRSEQALEAALQRSPEYQQLLQVRAAKAALDVLPGSLTGQLSGTPSSPVVSLAGAVSQDLGTVPLARSILESSPGLVWSLDDLMEAMQAKGWQTDAENPRNALSTALLRLASKDRLQKVSRGRYVWPTEDPVDDRAEETDVDEPDAQGAEEWSDLAPAAEFQPLHRGSLRDFRPQTEGVMPRDE